MKIIEYAVVAEQNYEVFYERMKGFIECGWQPFGNFSVNRVECSQSGITIQSLQQPIVKYEEDRIYAEWLKEFESWKEQNAEYKTKFESWEETIEKFNAIQCDHEMVAVPDPNYRGMSTNIPAVAQCQKCLIFGNSVVPTFVRHKPLPHPDLIAFKKRRSECPHDDIKYNIDFTKLEPENIRSVLHCEDCKASIDLKNTENIELKNFIDKNRNNE